MKPQKIILLPLLTLFAWINSACEKTSEIQFEPYLIKIDSVQVKNPIESQSAELLFYATVGNNGCYEFSHFEVTKGTTDVKIKVWGNKQINAEVCTQVMVYLNASPLLVEFSTSGNWQIQIVQPDNSLLELTLEIPDNEKK